ncbi:MAG: hypothetical protein J6K45_05100 [Clostridia bacterium]|nr:hypothetical protein [Clostridia bacterium]
MEMEREKFLKAYSKVFDPSGRIMFCGRANCIALLNQCPPGVNYGNDYTGFLNVPEIKALLARQFPEIFFREKLMTAYLKVFSKDGSLLKSSFSDCLELMILCKEGSSKAAYYGNMETGWLYVPAIKSFVAKIYPEIIFRELFNRVFDSDGNVVNSSEYDVSCLMIAVFMVKPDFHVSAPLVSWFDPISVKNLYYDLFHVFDRT